MNARRGLQMILAAVMFAALVPMVSGGVAQNWHLVDVDYTGTDAVDGTYHYKDLFVNKTGNATGSRMNLPNATEKTTWWYAECPAEFDGVAFGEGDWILNLDHGPTGSCTIWANVCKVNDSTGEVTYLANGSVTPAAGTRASVIVCYDLPQTSQIFNVSERLALRMHHNRSNDLWIYYYDVEDKKYSNLASPVSDPGYPVPELSTLVLISIGLVMLVCIVSFKRSKSE